MVGYTTKYVSLIRVFVYKSRSCYYCVYPLNYSVSKLKYMLVGQLLN